MQYEIRRKTWKTWLAGPELTNQIPNAKPKWILANCVHYAKINNSMLRMHGHISAGFFFATKPSEAELSSHVCAK